jgi:hypothetical protein
LFGGFQGLAVESVDRIEGSKDAQVTDGAIYADARVSAA